jgi:hypothetical protein
VRARYDWERVSADTEAVYAEVLAGVRRRRTTVEVLR